MEKQIELFVPGRLCLFGEHTDWAGYHRMINSDVTEGKAIVTGIDQGIYARAKKSDELFISTLTPDGKRVEFSCEMNLELLKKQAAENNYFSYACGVAAYICEHYRTEGVALYVTDVTLPVKKGLSSSAAFCVLVARAFNRLYKLRLNTIGEMQAAYRGECLTKSRCGRLDQACAYGTQPICMTFDGDEISINKLRVGQDFYWVYANLGSSKDTIRILADLNRCYPFPADELQRRVHEALGPDNLKIVNKAIEAIEAGDAPRLGMIMTEAQQLFDEKVAPASPEELAAPVLHSLLKDETIKQLTFGGKGVGSQGDGSVQFLAKDEEAQQKLIRYLKKEKGMDAFPFVLSSKQKVKKAIVPVAGFGTRMYPATRFIKKAFVPIVDYDGYAKPAILVLLEELNNAGIEEIILIVGEGERQAYESIFNTELTEEHLSKLSPRAREYEMRLQLLGQKLRYVVQKERRGFGHAVYLAKEYLQTGEPVLLSLGDHVYHSNTDQSCAEQMISVYDQTGKLCISVKEIPLQDVVHYGIIKGEFEDDRHTRICVDNMVEKPSTDYAEDHLGMMGIDGEYHYYSTFGTYVLTPEVFDELKKDIDAHEGSSEEIQLTSALQKVCREKGMYATLINGKSYDVGIPEAYKQTVSEFGKQFKSEDVKIWGK